MKPIYTIYVLSNVYRDLSTITQALEKEGKMYSEGFCSPKLHGSSFKVNFK